MGRKSKNKKVGKGKMPLGNVNMGERKPAEGQETSDSETERKPGDGEEQPQAGASAKVDKVDIDEPDPEECMSPELLKKTATTCALQRRLAKMTGSSRDKIQWDRELFATSEFAEYEETLLIFAYGHNSLCCLVACVENTRPLAGLVNLGLEVLNPYYDRLTKKENKTCEEAMKHVANFQKLEVLSAIVIDCFKRVAPVLETYEFHRKVGGRRFKAKNRKFLGRLHALHPALVEETIDALAAWLNHAVDFQEKMIHDKLRECFICTNRIGDRLKSKYGVNVPGMLNETRKMVQETKQMQILVARLLNTGIIKITNEQIAELKMDGFMKQLAEKGKKPNQGARSPPATGGSAKKVEKSSESPEQTQSVAADIVASLNEAGKAKG